MSGRRMVTLLVILAAIGIPAGVLQAMCVGRSCDAGPPEPARVPFCPLPEELKTALANGYREGRSPDVMGVTTSPTFSEILGQSVPWPSTAATPSDEVPIAFVGAGVRSGAPIAPGATLDRVAPTIAEIVGFERPFPEVRSGEALPRVANGERPRLVIVVAWKGVGSAELSSDTRWPFLASLEEVGAATFRGRTGSLPLDPAATLTTVGTGGLPSQHGITGSFVRDDGGVVRRAFGEDAPIHVISTLADDLEEADPRTRVALVGSTAPDLGLVGGGWYPGQEPVEVILGNPAGSILEVGTLLDTGYGSDGVPDVIGVALEGSVREMDRLTRLISEEAEALTDGRTLVVVVGTGSALSDRLTLRDDAMLEAIEDAVPGERPVVEAVAAGGVFLDRDVMEATKVTGQVAVDALLGVTEPSGDAMMADAFQGFAVSFARYC